MNPYLEEGDWVPVHTRILTYAADALGEALPPDLVAQPEEQLKIETAERDHLLRPDVSIAREDSWKQGVPPTWQPVAGGSAGDTIVAEPDILIDDVIPERWIEIREFTGKLVTVIEILSPTNKDGGSSSYREKRHLYLHAGVHVVEIDLLRAGRYVLAAEQSQLRGPQGARYLVCVTRSPYPERHEVYYCPLRDPLPAIRIPLREKDADVPLALQPAVNRCYKAGRFWQTDYHRPLTVPLPPDDEAWLDERLRAAGLRQTT